MSAAMARQGGRVQLEQSDMHLAVNMDKIAKEGYSRAAIHGTKYRIKKPHAKVCGEKILGGKFPGHKKGKAAIERHPAMLRQNHTSSCLPYQHGTAKHPQICCRCKGTDASPPDERAQLTPHPTPPTLICNNSGAQRSRFVNLPPGYRYSHTALRCAEFFNFDPSAQDSQHDTDFDPDMLTDEETSTN